VSTQEGIRPRLRPLSLGEILDVSIKICVRHWRTLVKAVLVVIVPVMIVSSILTADYTVSSFDFGSDSSQTPEEAFEELNQYLGGLAIASLLQVLAVLLASAACFRAIAQAYLGDTPGWRASLSYAWHRAPSLLLITVLFGLGVLLGTLALIVPGIWLYLAWSFAIPVLLVEGLRGRKALGRSFELVKGRWWRTFGVIVVGFILGGVVSAIVQGVFSLGIIVEPDNDLLVVVINAIATTVAFAIATPFQAALVTVVYFDLRVRKEGFDLELLARGIGAGVPAAQADDEDLWPVAMDEIDRTGAPYWPPPPGWKPPGAAGPGDAGPGGDEPPRVPGTPSG
jgi:MFS family permease